MLSLSYMIDGAEGCGEEPCGVLRSNFMVLDDGEDTSLVYQ